MTVTSFVNAIKSAVTRRNRLTLDYLPVIPYDETDKNNPPLGQLGPGWYACVTEWLGPCVIARDEVVVPPDYVNLPRYNPDTAQRLYADVAYSIKLRGKLLFGCLETELVA